MTCLTQVLVQLPTLLPALLDALLAHVSGFVQLLHHPG